MGRLHVPPRAGTAQRDASLRSPWRFLRNWFSWHRFAVTVARASSLRSPPAPPPPAGRRGSAYTRYYIAHWTGKAGDAAGAIAAFEELLSDEERVLGADHPHTLETLDALAYWLQKAGDAAGAVAAYEQLLERVLGALGTDHPIPTASPVGVERRRRWGCRAPTL
ncbi:tetratricopeptide repeat protein [Streptomyces luteogriseus]|uniref:tetratricopeptide repeat protein n=1 Tax=Streptomyces luteogriseus TaxID=68233 RepID=UPI0037B687B0